MSRSRVWLPGLFALAGACAGPGCGPKDEIRSYQVPKSAAATDAPPANGTPAVEGSEYRLLGAMFPAEEPTWFFKLTGSAAAVAEVEPAFDQFLASVRFPDPAKPPTYDLPVGWKSTGAGGIAADTIVLGPPGKPLKLTVTRAGGAVAGNAERWAKQLGSTEDPAKGLKDLTTAAGVRGVRVAYAGPTNPAGGMSPPFMRGK